MPKSLVLQEQDGKRMLSLERTDLKATPAAGHAIIRHTAIAASFYDMEMMRGGRPEPSIPFIPGICAAGIVERAGANVAFKRGDRVIYMHPQGGAYTQARTIDARFLHGIPDKIPDDIAVAGYVRSALIHCLLYHVFSVKKNTNILITGAAGGTGHMLAAHAKYVLGANVYGTVSTPQNARFAEKFGCDIIESSNDDVREEIRERTDGRGIDVVYDGTGNDMTDTCFAALRPMGLLCGYGNAGGGTPNIPHHLLESAGYFYCRPSVFVYKSRRKDAVLTALEVFSWMEKKALRPHISQHIPFTDIGKAHTFLRDRKHQGTAVITMK